MYTVLWREKAMAFWQDPDDEFEDLFDNDGGLETENSEADSASSCTPPGVIEKLALDSALIAETLQRIEAATQALPKRQTRRSYGSVRIAIFPECRVRRNGVWEYIPPGEQEEIIEHPVLLQATCNTLRQLQHTGWELVYVTKALHGYAMSGEVMRQWVTRKGLCGIEWKTINAGAINLTLQRTTKPPQRHVPKIRKMYKTRIKAGWEFLGVFEPNAEIDVELKQYEWNFQNAGKNQAVFRKPRV